MGRVWTAVLVLAVLVVVGMVLFSTESPGAAGTRFMSALVRADAKEAASLSLVEGRTVAELEKDWKGCFDYTSHYLFAYEVSGVDTPTDNVALVRLKLVRNITSTSYEENFTLRMLKGKDGWKADVVSLNRDFYPWLPRFSK